MATFPHSLCGIRQDGHGEQHMPMVLRSDMERGIPKQRRAGADVLVRVPCSLVFRSAADAAAFEAWFYAEGMGWFDFTLPRTGAVVQARIIGGDIGTLSPLTPAWNASERSVVLEYVRPAFVTLAPGLYDVDSSRILSVQRNSTATYIDGSGVLQTAPANTARYQGGQLLVEGQATNLTTNGSNPSAWPAFGLTKGSAVAAPNGSTTAVPFLESAVNEAHYTQFGSVAVVSGLRYVYSVFCAEVSGGAKRYASILLEAGPWGGFPAVSFDVATGVAGTAIGGAVEFGAIPVAGGYRIWLAFVAATSGTAGAQIRTAATNAATLGGHLGNTASGMVLWGRQIEQKDAGGPTSYIPTTTTAVTRAADIITVAA